MLSARAGRRLAGRSRMRLDAARAIAIKRNVHEFELDADADALACTLEAILAEPDATFGPLVIKRPAARAGAPFEVGDRFHGCFALPRGLGALGALLEDAFLSDYCEVTHIERRPGLYRERYAYLEGTPIAGQSELVVECAAAGARVTQVFTYQELGMLALTVVQCFAARLHDEIAVRQVEEASCRLGARMLWLSLSRP